MREVSPKFSTESFFVVGFPYAGELSYGLSSGLMDRDLLVQVVAVMRRRGLPLTPEEAQISDLLPGEDDSLSGLIESLAKYEKPSSGAVWQYYVSKAIADGIGNLPRRFDVLYSAWADFDYPMEMKDVIYPEGDLPSTIDVTSGMIALNRFLEEWDRTLSRRVPDMRSEEAGRSHGES